MREANGDVRLDGVIRKYSPKKTMTTMQNNKFIKENNNFARASHFSAHFFAFAARPRCENV